MSPVLPVAPVFDWRPPVRDAALLQRHHRQSTDAHRATRKSPKDKGRWQEVSDRPRIDLRCDVWAPELESTGAAVAPGARFTYVWQLDAAAGPRPDEPSSKAWLYHSHVSGDFDPNLGLIGALVVTDPRRARPDGTPNDVEREFATLFMIFDESGLDAAAHRCD